MSMNPHLYAVRKQQGLAELLKIGDDVYVVYKAFNSVTGEKDEEKRELIVIDELNDLKDESVEFISNIDSLLEEIEGL